MTILVSLFYLFFQSAADKPTSTERQIMLLIVAAFVGAFFKWLFDWSTNKAKNWREDTAAMSNLPDKFAGWIQRFQELGDKARLLEDEIDGLRKRLRIADETGENYEQLKADIRIFFNRVEPILHDLSESSLLEMMKEIQFDLKTKEPAPTSENNVE